MRVCKAAPLRICDGKILPAQVAKESVVYISSQSKHTKHIAIRSSWSRRYLIIQLSKVELLSCSLQGILHGFCWRSRRTGQRRCNSCRLSCNRAAWNHAHDILHLAIIAADNAPGCIEIFKIVRAYTPRAGSHRLEELPIGLRAIFLIDAALQRRAHQTDLLTAEMPFADQRRPVRPPRKLKRLPGRMAVVIEGKNMDRITQEAYQRQRILKWAEKKA